MIRLRRRQDLIIYLFLTGFLFISLPMECNQVTHEINNLLRISRRFNAGTDFREIPVVCQARTGQIIRFTSPEAIPYQLIKLISKFQSLCKTEHALSDPSQAFSLFWFGFIAIHPFTNGNGRTGKLYLIQKAREMGYVFHQPKELDSILLRGNVQQDLKELHSFFLQHLTRITE